MNRVPEIIIVELADGSVISAELVRVVNDANIPALSVAHYRQQTHETFKAAAQVQSLPKDGPEQAALEHANWAVAQLNKAMGL